MASSVLQLCDTPIDLEFAEKLPSAPYSFPNGFTKVRFHSLSLSVSLSHSCQTKRLVFACSFIFSPCDLCFIGDLTIWQESASVFYATELTQYSVNIRTSCSIRRSRTLPKFHWWVLLWQCSGIPGRAHSRSRGHLWPELPAGRGQVGADECEPDCGDQLRNVRHRQ